MKLLARGAVLVVGALFFVLVAGAPSRVPADQYSFITLKLPHGIKLDAPRFWQALNEEQNRLIALSRDAALDLSGTGLKYTGHVLFAANSTPSYTYASIRVSIDPASASAPQDITDLINADDADISAGEPDFRTEMDRGLAVQGLKVLNSIGLFKEQYGAHPAISYRYRRTGSKGPVVVDLIQIWREDAMVRINPAYRESEASIWRLVTARIKSSIRVD